MTKRNDKIQKWNKLTEKLAQVKAEEMELRKELLKDCFDYSEDDREGTTNFELGNGYKLKAGFKLSRKLENKNNEVHDLLEEFLSVGPEGKLLSERIVKWKPELSKTEYDKLPEAYRTLVDDILTSKPSTPSLKFVVPKGKK